jgi:D-threo-aldose 1-dehydrogenase
VDRRAAALQFGFGHPTVASVIPGARTPEELAENVRLMEMPIPADLWGELRSEGLLPDRVPVPTPSVL